MPMGTAQAQDGAVIEAQRMATNVWRLTAGRPALDGRNSTIGRLDFVLQVLSITHTSPPAQNLI